MKQRWPFLAGACVIALGTVLVAQPPAGPPPGGAPKGAFPPGGPGGAKGKGPGRGAPQYQLEKGKEIDPRPSVKTDGKPLFPEQTRAPYEASGQEYEVKVITDKLQQPWAIAFLPDGKMLVTEKPGNLRTVTQDGVISEPLAGVPKVHFQGQVGLLDLALDKNFAQNRRIFFTYSENMPGDEDSHIVLDSATLSADAASISNVKRIFSSMPALSNRALGANQGGRIAVDRDGNLFVIIGDRASGPKPLNHAQDPNTTIGKVLHMKPDGSPVGKSLMYSLGHRSPEGLAINPANGDLWSTEHGPQGGDELNKIEEGKNYGWPIISHGIDYGGQPMNDSLYAKDGMEQPRYFWNPVIAPSGMAFYQGNQFPGWKDSIFAGGLGGQLISRLRMDWKTNKVIGEEPLLIDPAVRTRVRDVRFGPDGMMYVLSDQNSLLKITPKK